MQTSLKHLEVVREPVPSLPPANDNLACRVGGCAEQGLVIVAGDRRGDTRLCVRHAMAWTQSSACRDFAQHNSSASLRMLSTWLRGHAV